MKEFPVEPICLKQEKRGVLEKRKVKEGVHGTFQEQKAPSGGIEKMGFGVNFGYAM